MWLSLLSKYIYIGCESCIVSLRICSHDSMSTQIWTFSKKLGGSGFSSNCMTKQVNSQNLIMIVNQWVPLKSIDHPNVQRFCIFHRSKFCTAEMFTLALNAHDGAARGDFQKRSVSVLLLQLLSRLVKNIQILRKHLFFHQRPSAYIFVVLLYFIIIILLIRGCGGGRNTLVESLLLVRWLCSFLMWPCMDLRMC